MTYDLECRNCGDRFKSKFTAQHYCSEACRRAWNRSKEAGATDGGLELMKYVLEQESILSTVSVIPDGESIVVNSGEVLRVQEGE